VSLLDVGTVGRTVLVLPAIAAAEPRGGGVVTEGRRDRPTLRALRLDDEREATAAHAELTAEGFTFLLDRDRAGTFGDYLALLERMRRGTDDHPTRVRSTFLVAELDGDLVGRVSIRHELNEFLRREGGHIGFAVRPAHRRRGIATALLEQALHLVAADGVDEALVTCDHDNVGSRTVIERCGGRYVGEAINDRGVTVLHHLVRTGRGSLEGS
jgi:predicted acetyltransferase